jgi:hypothetical protein
MRGLSTMSDCGIGRTRRNSRDVRRSWPSESFILSFPVPRIVLAENPRRKKPFIVIDGKQRPIILRGDTMALLEV